MAARRIDFSRYRDAAAARDDTVQGRKENSVRLLMDAARHAQPECRGAAGIATRTCSVRDGSREDGARHPAHDVGQHFADTSWKW